MLRHSVAKVLVEIAAHTIESAVAAQNGGADRVELFSNPLEGGVTPSYGLISAARKRISTQLHVMIRPRGGDFCYSQDEFATMLEDIEIVKRLGANGIAVGIVTPEGTVDFERLSKLISASRPLSVTFHRAFDVCRDLPKALEELIACGVDRVLTSGGEPTAWQGVETLAHLMRIAEGRIPIIAAGSIKPENAQEIVQRTGIREVHAGLRRHVPGPMRFRNERVSFGPTPSDQRITVNEMDVRELVEAVAGL
jgi:copper homeostasis protein